MSAWTRTIRQYITITITAVSIRNADAAIQNLVKFIGDDFATAFQLYPYIYRTNIEQTVDIANSGAISGRSVMPDKYVRQPIQHNANAMTSHRLRWMYRFVISFTLFSFMLLYFYTDANLIFLYFNKTCGNGQLFLSFFGGILYYTFL